MELDKHLEAIVARVAAGLPPGLPALPIYADPTTAHGKPAGGYVEIDLDRGREVPRTRARQFVKFAAAGTLAVSFFLRSRVGMAAVSRYTEAVAARFTGAQDEGVEYGGSWIDDSDQDAASSFYRVDLLISFTRSPARPIAAS